MADINRKQQAAGNVEGNPPSTVSERKHKANQQNAKKSTGPKDTSKTRFNALKHGLLAKRLIFSPDGKPTDAGLQQLFESLLDKYGRGDVYAELLMEGVVTEYWRLAKGLKLDISNRFYDYCANADSGMANLIRYNTASRRAMLKNLELLETLQEAAQGGEAEVDDDLLEDEPPTLQGIPSTEEAGSGQAGASRCEQAEAEFETSSQPEAESPKAA